MQRGFTLIELTVTMAILAILVGFSSWAYLNIEKNSDLSSQTNQLVSTIRQVQALAMSGQNHNQTNQLDMGLHFQTTSYTIFSGSTYNPVASDNIVTDLPSSISLTPDLAGADLLFLKNSGEVKDYQAEHNSLILSQSGGNSHTIRINRLGVVEID